MADNNDFPVAIPAPDTLSTNLGSEMLTHAVKLSKESPRGRIIQRLHKKDDAILQRMLNVMQPGSYMRAHRHLDPPKPETFIVLKGAVRYVEFDENGTVIRHADMRPDSEVFGVDIEPGVWHALIVLEPDSVIFEVKSGPYSKSSDKDFPNWAPEEDTPEAAMYLAELKQKTD